MKSLKEITSSNLAPNIRASPKKHRWVCKLINSEYRRMKRSKLSFNNINIDVSPLETIVENQDE